MLAKHGLLRTLHSLCWHCAAKVWCGVELLCWYSMSRDGGRPQCRSLCHSRCKQNPGNAEALLSCEALLHLHSVCRQYIACTVHAEMGTI